MKQRDYTPLLAQLEEEYHCHSPQSAALNDRAARMMVDGGNHALRLIQPFPPRIAAARGAWLTDEDGHQILDFWQGHLANVLGHNPAVVREALAEALTSGMGLQTGFTDRLQVETAEILCRLTGSERVRFTTSGTLSTMYSILLSRAYTGRDLVMKVGGGWHGAQPWALKGINYYANGGNGFQRVETEGLPPAVTDEVLVTGFNDTEMLHDRFRRYGDRVACFIVEPFLGAGGFVPGKLEFLRAARELTHKHGAVLIFDEVIAGFRFRAGNLGALYGVQPDLATFGKVAGGGMPVAAVAGRADILELAGRSRGSKVKFSGGTYSGHPASMLAAKTMMTYLAAHEAEIYPRLADLGEKARTILLSAFAEAGIHACCTGDGNETLRGSSMFMLHFPYDGDGPPDRPEDCSNPAVCDTVLSRKVLDLAFLVEDLFVPHSHGGLSMAHTEADLEYLGDACRRIARRVKPYL